MTPQASLADPESIVRTFKRPGPRAWVRVGAAATHATVIVNGQTVGEHLGAWTPFEFEITPHLRDENALEIRCTDRIHATNGFLATLGVRWCGARDVEIRSERTPPSLPARQRSAARGTQLLVDGEPFRVRGVLHWGHYRELGHAWPDEQQIRREILDLRALGFNLIKFCLWVPPPRYYELCDELGMLVWQEYPVWDAPLDRAVVPEFEELFRSDGRHPCIILRTLTCENYRVDPDVARELVDLCHRLIPGSLVLDNSAWLCSERCGDFHDEHPYLHNAQWRYYARRLRGKLSKPLLLGECMAFDTLADSHLEPALAMRRYQIETLARDLPDAGYVVGPLRDRPGAWRGVLTAEGRPKYTPAQWSWHREPLGPPRDVPELCGPVIGPRKGQWKCREYHWWSPIVRVLDESLPAELIERECLFELLSGRVLDCCEGTRVLVEVADVHRAFRGETRHYPVVIEFRSQGRRQVVSAFRHDTPAGRELWQVLQDRVGPAPHGGTPGVPPAAGAEPPEIGPLVGTSVVLEDWEMSRDGRVWTPVKCDTPLVNRGANMFEGWATFRTRVDYPGGRRVLRCESVGDYYEVRIDGAPFAEAGPREACWDSTRDIPREFEVDLPAGYHELEFRVRDWRGGGGMVGPVYLATDLSERVF